jgi:hypothetical protein
MFAWWTTGGRLRQVRRGDLCTTDIMRQSDRFTVPPAPAPQDGRSSRTRLVSSSGSRCPPPSPGPLTARRPPCAGLKWSAPKPGSATYSMPGFDIRVLSDEGHELPRGELGNICIKLPLPPGCFPTVWANHGRKIKSYLTTFKGFYESGDYGYIDADGYIFSLGRVDDIINVAVSQSSCGRGLRSAPRDDPTPWCAGPSAVDGADGRGGVVPPGCGRGSGHCRPG